MARKTKMTIAPSILLKAYNNYDFLNSPQARIIRVLSEMVEPESRFRKKGIWNTVVFFGSARTLPKREARRRLRELEAKARHMRTVSAKVKADIEQAKRELIMSRYYEDAVSLAEKMTYWFKELDHIDKHFRICTGGGPGIMEAANRGAKKAGGESIGLNISLPMEQNPNPYQTRELSFEFHYFFIRKFWFFYLGKALVVFPGGFGTMDEFFELLTIIQTHKTKKPMPVILYGSEFWNEVLNIEALAKWGTISRDDLQLFTTIDTVDEAFDYLKKELTRFYINPRKRR